MQSTEEAFLDALGKLMERFPYDSISIQGICDKAGFSRKTFSRYFSSKEDLVIAKLRRDVVNPTENVMRAVPVTEVVNPAKLLLTRAYSAFYENRSFYKKIYNALGPLWLMEQCIQLGTSFGSFPYENDGIYSETEISFVISLYSAVTAIALRWWIEHDFAVTPEELANLVIKWGYASFRKEESGSQD